MLRFLYLVQHNTYVFLIALVLIISNYSNNVYAQTLNKKLCKQFLEATEFYVLDNEVNTMELKTSQEETFSFETVVRENWPDKKVILLKEEDYNRLKKVKHQFFISISTLMTMKSSLITGYVEKERMGVIIIQKGRIKLRTSKKLYSFYINLNEISQNILAERLIYAVQNLKSILKNYKGDSLQEKGIYKTAEYKKHLKSHALYIRKNNLSQKFKTKADIKEIYPYRLRVLSEREWTMAIKRKKEGVLFLELIPGGRYSAVNIYTADEGKMIIGSYPWFGMNYLLDKAFFKRILY